MSKKLIALLIFAVTGSLAVAAEQPKSVTVGDCTCTGIHKSTGKPWTEAECKSACELQKSLGNQFSSFANPNPTLVAQAGTDEANGTRQGQTPIKELTRMQVVLWLVGVALAFSLVFGLLAWKSDLLKPFRGKKKKRYRTDQEKAALTKTQLPAAPITALPATTAERPSQVALAPVTQMRQPESAVQDPPEIVDVMGRPDQLDSIVFWLEKAVNPNVYPWAKWGTGLSVFTMGWRGFQPEMEVKAGGIEISIQRENEQLWLEVITHAIREAFPVSLKLVVIEKGDESSVFALMPEESVQYALSGECNLLTLTEGLRQHLLHSAHEQRRAANQ